LCGQAKTRKNDCGNALNQGAEHKQLSSCKPQSGYMKKFIDIANWNRREHFDYFAQFEEPFHGIVVNLDCTVLYRRAKIHGDPFFLRYLHASLRAVNANAPFRYRIENNQVVDYDTIHTSTTITRADHTYGFCPIPFQENFQQFSVDARHAMQLIKDTSGLCASAEEQLDVIHFSTLPWIQFTGLSHARFFKGKDSVPKISVGKCFQDGDRLMMPMAIYVHHGLADGYHVHAFIDTLQAIFNEDAAT
jgi:chloramphenicol O-acetyltransferase type A